MSQVQIEGSALVAALVAMIVISVVADDGPAAVLIGGGVLLALGLAVLTALRYLNPEEDQ